MNDRISIVHSGINCYIPCVAEKYDDHDTTHLNEDFIVLTTVTSHPSELPVPSPAE